MDELQLSETEQRYFSDLFLCCDNDNTGKVSINKAIELFRSGNVPNDVLNQITEICCQKQNQQGNYFSRKQFFSILKLIAAHQANVPVRVELLTSFIELPLPRFTWPSTENRNSADLIELSEQNHIRDRDRKLNNLSYKPHLDSGSTDSEVEVPDGNEILRNGSPEASSTASDSPTPTNSVQERSWAVSGNWQGLVCEEQRQLLGTEEESSDRHSSEEDTEVANEVWTITSEQREYYTNQFRSLQPDPNGLLAGPIARLFFEKSRLPVAELRKIWQLSDVTKDGALSLGEFNTAMHLVVLRRNHISLPNNLPAQLIPTSNPTREETTKSASPSIESVSPAHSKDTAKEWTKFVDSPTSSISSPGPKPVNFDFQKASVEKDPKILHPVALRLTPDIASVTEEASQETLDSSPKKALENTLAVNQNDIRPIQRPQPKKLSIPGRGAIPPPPQTSATTSEDGGGGPVGPVSLPGPKKEPPPPPPPRPFRSHGRSSSLDLNRLGKSGLLGAPPTVPPRVSPNISSPKKLVNQRSEGDVISLAEGAFANFDQFQQTLEPIEKYENVSEGIFPGDAYEADRKKLFAQFTQGENNLDTTDNAPRKHGAFEVYRKPIAKKESPIPSEEAAKWELFKKLKEQNTVLLRLCQELSQELADVREERTTLRLRLEQQQQQQSAG